MVMRVIYPLAERDMFEFLALFESRYIDHILVELYNGTGSGVRELPNGCQSIFTKFEGVVPTVELLQSYLADVTYNQIQKCTVYLRYGEEAAVVSLSLVELELTLHDNQILYSIERLLQFARTKGLRKTTIGSH